MKTNVLYAAIGGIVLAAVAGVVIFSGQLTPREGTSEPGTEVAALSNPVSNTPQGAKDSQPAESAPKVAEEPAGANSETEKSETEIAAVQSPDLETDVAADPVAESANASAETEAPAGIAPSFDVVRVEPDGQALVAGRAAPGSEVELKNGQTVIAKATADVNGDWVMILEEALSQGVSDLSLSAMPEEGGEAIASASNVTVALPENGTGELLVIETEPGAASKILAKVGSQDAPTAEPVEEPVVEKPVVEAVVEAAEEKVAEVAESAKEVVSEAKDATETMVAEVKEEVEQVAQKGAEVVAEAVEAAEGKQAEMTEPVAPVAKAEEAQPKEEIVVASKPVEPAPVEDPAKVAEPAKQAATAVEDTTKADEPATEPVVQAAPEPAVKRSVAIEAVEIEQDVLFVAGAAAPAGSVVRLYVDNRALTDTLIGESGRFLFDQTINLEPGVHQVRVDLIDKANGSVVTRAEVSFTKEAAPTQMVTLQGTGQASEQAVAGGAAQSNKAALKKVIIRRGDNLWTIARRVYGAGIRYSTIYDRNTDQIRDPHWIYPGQVFEVPRGDAEWEHNFDLLAVPGEADQSADAGDAVAQ